ncbi:MAG: sulfurtransferase [Acidimicrobiia bacterium]|nr:sulfurtransferase [Acidimicrobiia bacterium]
MTVPTDTHLKFQAYAHPDKLVSTEWLAEHLDAPGLVIVESDEDVLLYETGHIAGAVKIDWHTDLQDPLSRDYLDAEAFAELMSANGISRDTTVVFYGDNHNWWATYALWVFELFGHTNARLLDGGRQKWLAEGRPLTTDPVTKARTDYPIVERDDDRIRAFREDVMRHFEAAKPMVDVRSPEEFRGELLHMADYPQEGALRGGHIPGAHNVPWKRAAEEDGAFKPRTDLEAIYRGELGLAPDDEVVTYCRIGERSSHTWFVLTYLLGHDHVRNYDGSWTEWGNLVRAPIERP